MATPTGPHRVGLGITPRSFHQSLRSSNSASDGWSKWDIALYVGAPLAFASIAGIWYYRKCKGDSSKKKDQGEGDAGVMDSLGSKESSNLRKEPQSRQELAQASKTRGNRLFKEGKYEEAIACYTEAIKICPPDVKSDLSTFYQNRAAAYENQKQYDKVVEDCNSALELNSKYTKALARRSKAFEVQEKYRESLEDITKACLLESFQNQPYLQAADRVLKSLGRSRASQEYKKQRHITPSKFYIKNYLAGFVNDPVMLGFIPKETTDLVSLGVKIKEESEPDVDEIGDNGAVLLKKPTAFERAKHCLLEEDYEKIIPLCDEELIDPNSPHAAETLLLRGTMKLLQGQSDEAIEDLGRVGSMEKAQATVRATAMARQACLLMQQNPDVSSLSKFDEAKELDKKNSDLYHHHGQQLLQVEKLDEAVTQFNRSIELSSDFPISYVQKFYAIHRKAVVEEDLMLLAQAKEGFEKTLDKFPRCSDALILYAQALSDQGKFDEADKYFSKAITIQPENANNMVHKGLMLLQWKGDVECTMKLLDDALNIDPTCQYAYEIRGTIEVQRGKLSDAIECFKKAISLSNSEGEMAHLYSLMEAAEVQVKVAKDLNIQLPSMAGGGM